MTTPNQQNSDQSKPRKTKVVEKRKNQSRHTRTFGQISFSTCVRTLSQVTMSRKGLLNLEMAVGLAVYLDAGKADKSAKAMLAEIYSKAGYDCDDSKGKDYKTVNRRIGASSALFGKLGMEVINHWVSEVESKGETRYLQAIAQHLVEMNFGSIDDILDYVGRTSNRTGPKSARAETSSGGRGEAANDASSDAAVVWKIAVGRAVVLVPKSMSSEELVALAQQILELAGASVTELAEAKGLGPEGAVERRLEAVAVPQDRRQGGK